MTLAFDARKHVRIALVLGVLVLAANAAFYAVVIHPRVRAAIDFEGSRVEFERELTMAEKQYKALQAYNDRLTAAQQNTAKFFSDILGTKQAKMIGIQQEIASVADEFGIDPQTVTMSNDAKQDDGLERFGIEIPIEGDYANLRKFLARLESSQCFLVVDRISLAGTKEGGLQLQLIIGVSTYFDAPWLKVKPAQGAPRGSRAS